MPDAQTIDGIESKFNMLVGDLDERGRRRWAATEAIALGRGGITAVALATGLSDRTIRTGIKELQCNQPLDSWTVGDKGVLAVAENCWNQCRTI